LPPARAGLAQPWNEGREMTIDPRYIYNGVLGRENAERDRLANLKPPLFKRRFAAVDAPPPKATVNPRHIAIVNERLKLPKLPPET
jgi:hypothetical protein